MTARGGVSMSDLICLSEVHVRRIDSYSPLPHAVPRVDDRRIISGMIFVIRDGLRWLDVNRPGIVGGPNS